MDLLWKHKSVCTIEAGQKKKKEQSKLFDECVCVWSTKIHQTQSIDILSFSAI